MKLDIVELEPINYLVPPDKCQGYGPCSGGVYLGVAPTDQGQPTPCTATLIQDTGNLNTLADAYNVPDNVLFVGDVPAPDVLLDDGKLYRLRKGNAPAVALANQAVINIQPQAGVEVPVNLRLVVNGGVRTVYIDPRA
jgi:hypothetical protein